MPERSDNSPDADTEPGSVSDQNREETLPGMPDGAAERSEDTGPAEGGAQQRGKQSETGGRVGGAGEGSQATGHPGNSG